LPHPANSLFKKANSSPHSDDEDEGQVVRNATCFTLNREVLMIHADKYYEGLERVQLDDYNDYLLDPLDEDEDATMDSVSPANIKAEDVDDIQKECHRIINAKRAQRRHHALEKNQQGSNNLHDSSTGDLRAIINTGRDAPNVIIARQQEREEVEAYSPTRYQLPLDYLETTRKRKLEAR
jgi:hypothetical protein